MKYQVNKRFCISCVVMTLLIIHGNALSATRGESITIVNNTGAEQKIYFMHPDIAPSAAVVTTFKALTSPCVYPTDVYSGQGNQYICNFTLLQGQQQSMPLTDFAPGKLQLAISAANFHYPMGPCNTTFAELTLNSSGNDSYDISTVNGRSFNIQISTTGTGTPISLKRGDDPKTTLGVYPAGCSKCVDGAGVAPRFPKGYGDTVNCPGYGQPIGPMPKGACKTGSEMNPKPNACGIDMVPTGGAFTVTFNAM